MAARPKSKKTKAVAGRSAAASARAPLSIGVLADTHGVLSPAIPELFAGVAHIIHAGDVGRRSILRRLEKVAPVTAVAGNADRGALATSLPHVASDEVSGVRFLVVHKPKAVKRLLPAAQRDGVHLIVTGHLHEPDFRWEDGILHLNPGTASAPEEGDSQPTVAIVGLLPEGLSVTFVPIPKVATRAGSQAKKHTQAGDRSKTAPEDRGQSSPESQTEEPKAAAGEEPVAAAGSERQRDESGSGDTARPTSPLPTVTFPDSVHGLFTAPSHEPEETP